MPTLTIPGTKHVAKCLCTDGHQPSLLCTLWPPEALRAIVQFVHCCVPSVYYDIWYITGAQKIFFELMCGKYCIKIIHLIATIL